MQSKTIIALLLACVALCPVAAVAGPQTASPDLGVARVSVVNGDVATRRGDSGDWIATTVNSPIVEGDSVRTTGGSRAEVQLSPGNFVRIVGESEAQFVELGEKVFRLRVIHGTVLYSELPDSPADIDIETPFAAVRPQQKGRYRIHVGADSTVVEVREGKTEIAMEHSTSSLTAGKAMTLWQGSSGMEFAMAKASNRDGFDRWASNRDRLLRRASAYRYISRDIYGVDTFDDHGSWRLVPSLGHCWFPRVPVTWVPYRHGHWTWIDYYGWNWVAYEPWGWATSHWGRWHHHPIYGWGWYPGTPRLRHIWRPALVSFIGAAIHSATLDRIAWVPLAPGELYRPWYGRSIYGFGRGRSAVSNTIVVDNSVNITNNYRYARGGRGVSAVSYLGTDQFGAAGANTPRGMRLSQSARGVAIRGPLPVVPSRASQGRVLPASSTSVRVAAPRAWNRTSVSQLRDGTTRVSFDDQRTFLRSSVSDFQRRYGSSAARPTSNTNTRAGAARSNAVRQVRTASSPTTAREPSDSPPNSPLQSQRRRVATPSARGSVVRDQAATAPRATSTHGQPLSTSSTKSAATPPASSAVRGGAAATARTSTRVPAIGTGQRLDTAVAPARAPRVGGAAGASATRSSPSVRVPTAGSSPGSATTPSRGVRGPVFAPRSRSRVGVGGYGGTTVKTSQQRVGTSSSGGLDASPTTGSSSSGTRPMSTRSTSGSGSRAVSVPSAPTARSSINRSGTSPSQRIDSTAGATSGNRGARQGSGSSAIPTFQTRTRSRITPGSSRGNSGVGASPSQRSTPSYRRPTVGATSSSRSSRTGSSTSSPSRRSSPPGVGAQSRTPSRVSPRSSSGGGLFGSGSSRSTGRSPSPPGVGATRNQRSTPSYRRPTVGATSSSRTSRIGSGTSSPSRRSSPSGVGAQSRTPSRVSPRSSSGGGLFGPGSSRSAGRSPSPPGVGATRSQRSTPSYRRPTVGAPSSSRSSRIGPRSTSPSSARPSYGGSRSSSSGISRSSSGRSTRPVSSSTTRRSSTRPADR